MRCRRRPRRATHPRHLHLAPSVRGGPTRPPCPPSNRCRLAWKDVMSRLACGGGEGGRSSASNGVVGARGSGRAAGYSNRRYRPWFTVGDGLPGGPAAACSIVSWFSIGRSCGVDRDGPRSAPGSDLSGVDRHNHRRALAREDRPRGPRRRAEVPARFRGDELEVALEATTGWRFVVEELERIGAEVHLAEPAEATAPKGKKKRADEPMPGICRWADARHLRKLLLIGRLPESWIPPAHILDSAPGSGPAICSLISERSGSSGCTRCSITTGARNAATCSRSRVRKLGMRPGRSRRRSEPSASRA